MPEALEKEEGGGGVGDLENDFCELRGQSLLDERLIGHPVTFFQGTINTFGGDVGISERNKRTVEYPLP